MEKYSFCEFAGDFNEISHYENESGYSLDVVFDGKTLSATTWGLDRYGETEEITARIRLDYCPKCGRKL